MTRVHAGAPGAGLPGLYHRRPPAGEVVAGLVNDGSADSVARAAVEEAASRHSAVRFVQVVPGRAAARAPGDHTPVDPTRSDERTFSAAMRALARHSRVRATFEVVSGDPVAVLVSRTNGASVLVLGEDQDPAAIAAQAQRRAHCPVRLVPLVVTPVPSSS